MLFLPSVAATFANFFAVAFRRLLVLLLIARFIGRLPVLAPYIITYIPVFWISSKCFHVSRAGFDPLPSLFLKLSARRFQMSRRRQEP